MKILIISIPLFAGISILSLGRYIGKKGSIILSIISILISVIISILILYNNIKYNIISKINIGNWFEIGIIKTPIELIYDKESVIMINLISLISFIVITYSVWYMNNDAHISRFLSKLLIFTVTMYILVTSNNFFLLFAGWETVGIMSYLLINFWYNSYNSNKSAFKAILYNKIGDIGYIIALGIYINIYNNTNIKNIFAPESNTIGENYYILNNLLLFFFIIAAIAKSAQIFLHCWLGDAMAGPTPVSALLHAATMVTAGVFLLIRLFPYFPYLTNEEIYQQSWKLTQPLVVVIIGGLTILFGGLSSIGQYDIKKLIAFSTCSQIGYMFINNGFISQPNWDGGSLFHLFTHGFFKALLFLSAGILIHNFYNDQDLRKYGSFIFKFPLTYIFILIGSLSIISFPFLSGFYSKENIIYNSFNNSQLCWGIILIIGALLTNLYSFKLLFSSFFFTTNSVKNLFFKNYGEIPLYFIPILLLLLMGSIFIGYFSFDYFIGPGISSSSPVDHELFPGHNIIKFIPFFIIFFVLFFYLFTFFFPSFINNLTTSGWGFYFITFFNRRAFFDPFFNYLFVFPSFFSCYYFFKIIDRGYLELLGPLGLFRSFFFFYKNYNISRQYINNINYLFLYFFLSLSPFLFFYLYY